MRLRTSNFHEALTEITAVPYPPPATREGNAWLALLALIAKGEVFFGGNIFDLCGYPKNLSP